MAVALNTGNYTNYTKVVSKMDKIGKDLMTISGSREYDKQQEQTIIAGLKLLIEKVQRGDGEWTDQDLSDIT